MKVSESKSAGYLVRKATLAITLASAAVVSTGTKACQEDYDFGSQTKIVGDTETVAPTVTPDGTITIVGTATAVPSATPAGTISATETPTPTAIGTATPIASPTLTLTPLVLSNQGFQNQNPPIDPIPANIDNSEKPRKANWLGLAFKKSELESGQSSTGSTPGIRSAGSESMFLFKSQKNDKKYNGKERALVGAGVSVIDTDGDGFSNEVEAFFKSDPSLSSSFPKFGSTSLSLRLNADDPDVDGLTSQEEVTLGTDPNSADTDGDGCPDGAEVGSRTDPTEVSSRVKDSDGDCLGDDYETALGTNKFDVDSDGDGLDDTLEVAIGSNPLSPDTDKDGILDWKEVQLDRDPVIAENLGAN